MPPPALLWLFCWPVHRCGRRRAMHMAAEQKARAVYENLIDLATSEDIIGPLLWLRQREIIHYNRFKELLDEYKKRI